jgi:glycosyltransferase involved in cell wall biosynthesis
MYKVLILTRYDRQGASSRIRFLQFLPELEKEGFEFEVVPLLDAAYLRALYERRPVNLFAVVRSYLRRLRALLRRRHYDLIWLEKEVFPWLPAWIEAGLLKGVPYIVDLDDAWFLRYEQHKLPIIRFFLGSKIDEIMRGAAVVIGGNDFLAERAHRAGARQVEVVPSTIDLSQYSPSSPALEEESKPERPVVVGWIGTPVTVFYLQHIEPVIRTILSGRDACLTIIGANTPAPFAQLPVRSVAWSELSETEELGAIDIGLMPLKNDPWEQGKCAYKLLQFMAAGKPVVASSVGANINVVNDNVSGFLVNSMEEWTAALQQLIASPSLRREMGAEGRQIVEREYSINRILPKLSSILLNTINKRKPKVLIVTRRMDIGGTERHIVRILPELRLRGIDASLFVLERGGRLESELAANMVVGPRVTAQNPLATIGRAWGLVRHLRQQCPDIIHFFLPEPYLIGSVAAMLAGPKVRVMSRRSLAKYQLRHPQLAKLEIWMHRRTTALLGNSNAVVNELVRECGDPSKVGLLYNGIQISPLAVPEARAATRRNLGVPSECLVLIVVANLMVYKGHDDLLRALSIANSRMGSSWRLLVVGRDDGIGASLRRTAESLDLQRGVMWLGERTDVEQLFDAADIAVLPSHEEGFSNSLIEAMSRGLPVVATAVGGNLDAIVPDDTGMLVAAKAPEALAEALVKLANDKDLRLRLGRAARRRVEERFSLESCVRRYQNLYRGRKLGSAPVQNIIEAQQLS